MRDGTWVLAFFVLPVYGYFFWIVYLFIARPGTLLEWFVRRPYRWWGLKVDVEDHAKFARRSRRLGVLVGVFAAAHATLMCWAIMSGKQ